MKKYILFFSGVLAVLMSVWPSELQAQNIFLYAGSASGTGGYTGDGTGLTSHELNNPHGLAYDHLGNIYIADNTNNRIRKISGSTISTIAGTGTAGYSGDGGPATNAKINGPMAIVTDDAGDIYFSDLNNNCIRKIDASGTITTVAGNQALGAGYNGEGSPATNYQLNQPVGVALDRSGNLYIGDQFNNRVRMVTPAGTISTFAGTGTAGFFGDGGAATAAKLWYPMFVRFDFWGNLFFADRENNRIRKITTAGIISTVAGYGTSGSGGDGGPATAANLAYVPYGLRFDGAGNLYIADGNNQKVRKIITRTGVITSSDSIYSIAGTGATGFTGDGGPATAATFNTIYDILLDTTGKIILSDGLNNVLRFIDVPNYRPHFVNPTLQSLNVCENSGATSINSLLAVNDQDVGQTLTWNTFYGPYHGTTNIALYTALSTGGTVTPSGLTYTPNSGYVGNDTIFAWVNDGLAFDTTLIIVTVNPLPAAISGASSVCPGNTILLSDGTSGGAWSSGNNSVATVNSSGTVSGVATGIVAISYTLAGCSAEHLVSVGGPTVITTIAGTGLTSGSSGDGGAATAAKLNTPQCVWMDASGNTYIGDVNNVKIRKIDPTGIITTFAGNGTSGYVTDGVPATSTEISRVTAIISDATGNIYFSDFLNNRVRKINTAGIISTIAGNGTAGFAGDGLPATDASVELNGPFGLSMDAAGNIYIADANNARVRKINTAGIISTIAGTGGTGATGDGGPATLATFHNMNYLRSDAGGNVYVADNGNHKIRLINASGYISTFAGDGVGGAGTDGVAATAQHLDFPAGIALDGAGNVYISGDATNNIRVVNPAGIISTYAGSPSGLSGYSGDGGAATAARLHTTVDVCIDNYGNLLIADQANFVVRKVGPTNANVGPISGAGGVCAGSVISLSDATSGGVWSSSNTSVATVGTGGVVTGVTAGTTIISYTVTFSCGNVSATQTVTVNNASAIAGPATVCVGSNITLTDPDGAGTWVSSNTSAATIGGGTGVAGGVAAGTTTITYTNSAGCNVTRVETVNALPAGISGAGSVCAGANVILSDASGAGSWTSSSPSVATIGAATGILGGVAAGTAIITFTLPSTGCLATVAETVNPSPGIISGPSAICVGSNVSLNDVTSGGTWTSSNTSVASVFFGPASPTTAGGVSAGTAVVTYMLPAGCYTTLAETVNPIPAAISGPNSLCIGSTTILSDVSGAGTWVSSNTSVATAGAGSGIIGGVATGTTTITFTLTATGCSITRAETVNPNPASISGSSSLCVGSGITLSDATGGGTWTSSNTSVATAGIGTGIIGGVAAGTTTITYMLALTGCYSTMTATVNAGVPAISGTLSACIGLNTSLSDASGGGAWSSSNGSVATIGGGTGIAGGVAVGTTTITYSLSAGCLTTSVLTVNPNPAGITPAGAVSICTGATTSLTDVTGGGAWSSSNNATATVNSSGVVTGVSAGTVTISYTLGTGCYSTKIVTVNQTPAAITPAGAAVCVGSNLSLTDATGGGAWSSSNTAAATVSAGTGVAGGVAFGTTTISYTLGTCFATTTLSVNPVPGAITPAGAVTLCMGATTSLTDATGGGAWSSSDNTIATVNSSGVVTGVAAGTVNISYALGTGCAVIKTVTVNLAPVAISPVSAAVCVGSNVTFTDATGGGAWSSSSAGVASVSGTGIAGGVSAGSATISYTIGTCYATAALTVNLTPAAITPAGGTTICAGTTASLTDATGGGAWSSSNTGVATVGATGVVTGVAAGTAIISYTTGSGCGVVTTVTVNTAPTAIFPIPATVCLGANVTLTDAIGGGAWSSSNTSVATIAAGGIAGGVAVGTTTISYAIGTCYITTTMSVNPLPDAGSISGPSLVCAGNSISLTDATAGGVWSSTNIAVATVDATGIVSAVAGGSATISYTVTNGCGVVAATANVVVLTIPSAGSISGASSVCAGTFTILTDAAGGGVWSSSSSAASITGTGLLTGISVGTSVISYTVTNMCGSATATKTITVGVFLTAGSISGPTSVCQGSTISLTDPAPGGVWSSSNGSASVTSGGVVTGVSGAVDTINYTVTASCGSAIASHTITVIPLPGVGSITGPSAVCLGSPVTFTDAVSGGVWSVTNATATITGGGMVTPVSLGTNIISYAVTNACGTAVNTKTIAINPTLTAGSISGPTSVCAGSSIVLTDATTGGIWSSSNSTAAVAGGTVTGAAGGIDTIYYTVTNTCGTVSASYTVTINPLPDAGTISGPSGVCIGTSFTFTDAVAGGVWSISNGSATITGGGMVTGVTSGLDTIGYTVTNGCGSTTATKIIIIGTAPSAGTIMGAATICMGGTIILSDAIAGGVWTSSNPSVAAIGSSTGITTGMSVGSSTITYTVSSGCGSAFTTATVGVITSPSAGTISGASDVCVSSTTLLTDMATGGAWSASNGNATVSGGLITAVTAGTDTIMYSVTASCGTSTATKIITVSSYPSVSGITGPTSVCAGATITLSEAATGGIWTETTGNTSVGSASGIVTGIAAGGDIVSYTITNACGTVGTSIGIIINPSPVAGAITGMDTVCVGATTTLTDAAPLGTWSAGNANATVAAGVVTGVTAGTDPISYSVSNSCGTATAVATVVILPVPSAGTITGGPNVCIGSTIILTDAVAGGVWLRSNSNANIIAPGVIQGVATGTDSIFYMVTNMCGTSVANKIITINPAPVVASISGASTICTGATATLSDATMGGTWSSSNTLIAAVGSASGIVSGVSAGTATITYSVVNTFGCGAGAVMSMTVNAARAVTPISGSSNICVGAGTSLSDATAGGSWSSSNPAIASIDAVTGSVSGISAGSTIISYAVTGGCGTTVTTATLTVNTLPTAAAIAGSSNVCIGSAITLSDATPGGVWSVTGAAASIGSATGIVTGLSTGSATVSYTVSNVCGSASSTKTINVGTVAPNAGAISGASTVCIGATIVLSETASGGTWGSSNSKAIVSSGGAVTGISVGIDTVRYTVTNSCGSASATKVIMVSAPPSAGNISGPSSVCAGQTITLSEGVPGGVWSSGNTSVASVSSAGVVTGISSGAATINYEVTNSCGFASASHAVTVIPIADCGTNTLVNNVGDNAVELKVFPNPNEGTFMITLLSPNEEQVQVTITNVVGQKVMELNTITNKETNVQLAQPAGIYFVTATTGNVKYVAKVTVR